MKHKKTLLSILLLILLLVSSCGVNQSEPLMAVRVPGNSEPSAGYFGSQSAAAEDDRQTDGDLPVYTGKPYVEVNQNTPFFTREEMGTEAWEQYSELDSLGRCGVAFANICPELMPAGERENIGAIRPSGWHTIKYDVIADRYLYNRCHLIGYQLAGENANEKNLITGTRYLNIEGMLPWENLVADYVERTGNHVLYRVTPCYEGENLVASGVRMEAFSVEDQGAGVCFHVYCYNVQPGIIIDYATGESRLDESWSPAEEEQPGQQYDYVLNTNTKRFHIPSCSSVKDMKEKNKDFFSGEREELLERGYVPCGRCKP